MVADAIEFENSQLIHPKLENTVQNPPKTTIQASRPPSGGGPSSLLAGLFSGAGPVVFSISVPKGWGPAAVRSESGEESRRGFWFSCIACKMCVGVEDVEVLATGLCEDGRARATELRHSLLYRKPVTSTIS